MVDCHIVIALCDIQYLITNLLDALRIARSNKIDDCIKLIRMLKLI